MASFHLHISFTHFNCSTPTNQLRSWIPCVLIGEAITASPCLFEMKNIIFCHALFSLRLHANISLSMANKVCDESSANRFEEQQLLHWLQTKRRHIFRFFRISFAFVSFTILSGHFYTLIQGYNEQPVTIETSNRDFEFPDIHICSQSPISDSRINFLAKKNDSRWLQVHRTISQLEGTKFANISNKTKRSIVFEAFWETLDPALIHELLALPKYESLLRLQVNDEGKNF